MTDGVGILTVADNGRGFERNQIVRDNSYGCLLYTSDAADERSSVDLGGRRIIKKKKGDDIRVVARVEIIQVTNSDQ